MRLVLPMGFGTKGVLVRQAGAWSLYTYLREGKRITLLVSSMKAIPDRKLELSCAASCETRAGAGGSLPFGKLSGDSLAIEKFVRTSCTHGRWGGAAAGSVE